MKTILYVLIEEKMTINRKIVDNPKSKVHASIYYLVQHLGDKLNRTKLVKLLFLMDETAKRKFGKTITGITYTYLLYGPYSDDIPFSVKEMDGYEIKETPNPEGFGYSYTVCDAPRIDPTEILDEKEIKVLDDIIKDHGYESLRKMLDYVYQMDCVKNADPLDVVLE